MTNEAAPGDGSRPTRRRVIGQAMLGIAALSLAACSAPASAPAPTAVQPAAPAAKPTVPPAPAEKSTVPPQPTAPPPAPAPTQAPPKPATARLRIVQNSANLAYAPVYAAIGRKYFTDEAIELDLQVVQGGAAATAAVVSGEAQFMLAGAVDVFTGVEKGLDLIAVASPTSSLTSQFVASNAFLKDRGVTPQTPLRDRVLALKGAKIGNVSLAGFPSQLTKYFVKGYGLDPEADIQIVATGGTGAPMLAAMQSGQIDLFVASAPDPENAEKEGVGALYINTLMEVPTFKSFVTLAFIGRKEWIEKNSDVTERVSRALGRANNLIQGNLPAAKEAIKLGFSQQIDPQVFDVAMSRLQPAFGPDARMDEQMWKNAAEVNVFAGAIKPIASLADGTVWTNKYLVNIPKQ